MGRERRKHKRVGGQFSIRLGGGGQVATSGMNISMGGIYCEMPHFVPVMTKLAATIVLPGADQDEQVLEAEMIVVWADPETEIPGRSSYQIGCAFLPMSDEKKFLLKSYIESVAGTATEGGTVQ